MGVNLPDCAGSGAGLSWARRSWAGDGVAEGGMWRDQVDWSVMR